LKLKLELEHSRSRIMEVLREMKALDERLAALPALEETQKRFQEAGLEERLKERSLVIREERVFVSVGERLDPVRTLHRELVEMLPFDAAFVSPKALEGLPNAAILERVGSILWMLSSKLKAIRRSARQSVSGSGQRCCRNESPMGEETGSHRRHL
jgi:hypothetical protein